MPPRRKAPPTTTVLLVRHGQTPTTGKELPGRAPDAPQKSAEAAEPVDRWKGIAEAGSALAAGLDAIVHADPSFDAKHFL